jgi:hypothetical protein
MAITISDTEPRVQYTATSGQTSFSVPFEFFTVSDIKVFNGSTQLSYNASPSSASQYSVTGAAVSGGGSITLGGGATLNDVITIYRDLAVARSTDFPTSGAFQIDSLNTELDKIIAMIQQVERDLKFSPRAAATTANTFNITFPNLAANKVLSVNSSGNGLEFSQDITDIQTIAGIASAVSNVSSISTAVSGVHSNATNINLVATNIGSVNAVAADIAKVVAVANDLAEAVSEVETVADDLNETTSEIEVVANNIANVNIVGGIDSSVTAVASKATEIGLLGVSGVITDMGLLGTSAVVTDMDLLATSANVTAMGLLGTSTVITDMGLLGTSSNVSAMATLGTSTNVTNMATLAGISGLGSLAAAHAAVSNVSTNLAAVQNFADVYRIASSAPTSSLTVGDLYFDTTANELKVYKSSGWAAAGSTVNGTSQRYTYTISGTPTTVTGSDANGNTLAYDAGYADVYVNGVRMSAADITITSGTSVVFASALANADIVDIVAYGTFNVASVNAANIDAGTLNIARIADDSITNAKLNNNSITINGSAVQLGGSVTVGETKPTITSLTPSVITNDPSNVVIAGANFQAIPRVHAINTSTGIWYEASTVTYTSASSITANFTLTVDSSNYRIRIENPDGNAVISGASALNVSDAPAWTTAAGSLGTIAGNFSGTIATVAATGDTVTFTEVSSPLVLTGGATKANCALSTAGVISTTDFGGNSTAATLYTFTIRATDAQGQYSDRVFTLQSSFGATGGGQFN